jgi:adenylate cyclase
VRAAQGAALGAVCACAALALWQTGALDGWEARTWDTRLKWSAKPSRATTSIGLVFLDQASLDWAAERMGLSWPWPREVYGAILDFCRRGGARAVAFDVLYTEDSVAGVEDDRKLGEAIRAGPPFAGALFASRESGADTAWPDAPLHTRLALAAPLPTAPALPTMPRATFPIADVATNAAVIGTVFGNPDPDGVYRRVQPVFLFAGRPVPALGLAAWLAAGGESQDLRAESGRLRIGDRAIPVDSQGRCLLRFRGPSQTHATVSAAAAIESALNLAAGEPPTVDPAVFTNRIVFLGFTAPGLFDLKPSPVSAVYPGVEIHATFLDNLMEGDFPRPAPRWLSWLCILLLSMAAGASVRVHDAPWRVALAFGFFLVLPPLAGVLALQGPGLWTPVVPAWAGITLALVLALGLNYAVEGRQKRFLKGAFRQYLSPVVIEQLVQHPERLQLGGETRDLTMYFSDIQGFTGFSETLAPEPLTALLNEYLTAMTQAIYDEGGTMDKYEGDAVIAFWNAPVDQPDHAARAVRAALRCQAVLSELRPKFAERFGVTVNARIGLNSGPVVVGNMGSAQRFNYTFLGDAGNLASRLEGLNKVFGTRILLSDRTRSLLPEGTPLREIALVRVVGRAQPVRVFEPLEPAAAAARQALDHDFAGGLQHFYAGRFREALDAFERLAAADPPSAAYARQCQALLKDPPPAWEGVWVVGEK